MNAATAAACVPCAGSPRSSTRDTAVPAPPPAPAARKVASWILTPPGKLADADRTALAQIAGRCEELQATRTLVRGFADMLRHRHGEHLEAGASQAEASPVSDAAALRRGSAPRPGRGHRRAHPALELRVVEGHVNRIKMLKRQMYGRANPDLLRRRILLAD